MRKPAQSKGVRFSENMPLLRAGFRKRIYPKKSLSSGNFSNVKISKANNRRLTFVFNRFDVRFGGAVFVELAVKRFAVES